MVGSVICLEAREINMNFDKTRVRFFPNFNRHHLITPTYFISIYFQSKLSLKVRNSRE